MKTNNTNNDIEVKEFKKETYEVKNLKTLNKYQNIK